MAQSKPKKAAASPTKRPVGKAAAKAAAKKAVAKPARPKAAKPKPVAKKAALASKKVTKKPVAKAKPAPKKAAPARKPAAKTTAKPAKRAVAVSARPQSAVAVQPLAVPAKPASRSRIEPLIAGAIPTEDQIRRSPDSAYMNDSQLAFFQERLLQMRAEVLTRELDVKERLHQREVFADPADRASAEEEHWLDLRLRERESLLLKKIDDALRRIRDREYGWCEKTGEPIGIARLLARPTATVCVDIKGQDERAESQYRDR